MKALVGTFAVLVLSILVVACGKNDSGNSSPAAPSCPIGQSYVSPYGCVAGNAVQCPANYMWNGSQCVVGNGIGGMNNQCTGGLIYTMQGCLPQGMCPMGQAQYGQTCVPGQSVNGGWPTGYNNGYTNNGYGYPNTGYGYPNTMPQTGYPTGYAPGYYGYGQPSYGYPGYGAYGYFRF